MLLNSVSFLVATHQFVFAQVIEGETSVVNVRDTDSSLSTLIYALVVLGLIAVVGTVVFGWFTRPRSMEPHDG